MKKIILVLVLVLLLATMTQAATLQFDPAENADGYLVYYAQGADQKQLDIGDRTNVDLTEFDLSPGVWVFYVTAYNIKGESGASNTAEYKMLGIPSAPTNFRIIIIVIDKE